MQDNYAELERFALPVLFFQSGRDRERKRERNWRNLQMFIEIFHNFEENLSVKRQTETGRDGGVKIVGDKPALWTQHFFIIFSSREIKICHTLIKWTTAESSKSRRCSTFSVCYCHHVIIMGYVVVMVCVFACVLSVVVVVGRGADVVIQHLSFKLCVSVDNF